MLTTGAKPPANTGFLNPITLQYRRISRPEQTRLRQKAESAGYVS